VLLRVGDVADVVARFLAVDDRIVFSLQSRHHPTPVFDDFRRLPVNFEPNQRLAEDAAMGERALHARMCAEIAKTPLQHQRLAKPFDVAAGERQLAEFQCRRLALRVVRVARLILTLAAKRRPRGTMSDPRRIGFVSVSGVDSNLRR